MSQIRHGAVFAFILLMLIAVSGCSDGNGAAMLDPDTGEHPGNWYTAHRTAYYDNPAACQECHGADLIGGISQVSCFSSDFEGLSCHAEGPSGHPTDWSSPSSHGQVAKSAPGPSSGFASCQVCHGDDFAGGAVNQSCFTCHDVSAPHPSSPWREGSLTHTNTNPENAVVCALCHAETSIPEGTTPGCFNNTLCHGDAHAAGWSAGSAHGIQAEEDFSACKTCHGDTYQGGSGASTSCYDCHNGPGLNHPASQWVISNHATEALADIVACQTCHGTDYMGGGSGVVCTSCHMEDETAVHMLNWYPDIQANHGAYASANGTASCATAYCHGTDLGGVAQSGPSCSSCHTWPYQGAHPDGWSAGSAHGIQAEEDFSACKACHGDTYQGGSGASTSCYECHNGPGLNHPASQWVISNHATEALADDVSCQTCHGTNYMGGGSGVACTICHMEDETAVHMLNWYPDIQSNHQPYAKANGTASCATAYCHGTDLGGVAQSGPSCSSCHDWPYTGGSCTGCHNTTRGTRDAVVNEFNLAWGHKNQNRAAVTDGDCVVCHLEGTWQSGTVGDPSTDIIQTGYHQDGNIDLRDPDATIDGDTAITDNDDQAWTFTQYSVGYNAGDRTTSLGNTTAEIITVKFCMACHDSDGAQNPLARSNTSGTNAMPFGGVPLGGNYTATNDAIGSQGLIDVASQFASGNSSRHPVGAPNSRMYPYSDRLADPYKYGTARDSNTQAENSGSPRVAADSVVMVCDDCHTSGTSLTNRTVTAHGTDTPFRGTYWQESATQMCTECHIAGSTTYGYPGNSGAQYGTHDIGSGFAMIGGQTNGGDARRPANALPRCNYCHFSNPDQYNEANRPRYAQDIHGFNEIYGTTSGWTWGNANGMRPRAFIRNSSWGNSRSPRPYSAPGITSGAANCGGSFAFQGGDSGIGCSSNGHDNYQPGGSY